MHNIFRQQYDKELVECQIHSLPEIYHDHFGDLTNGTFVEVGAYDCYQWSNTFMLVELGWSGLYIEPRADYFSKCLERYENSPRISLANVAIGDRSGTTKLFLGGSLTTIKSETVEVYSGLDWAKGSRLDLDKFVECKVETLDTVLDWHDLSLGFDVLVIDVEGAEEDVMKGFDLDKWKPHMAIVEAHEQMSEESLNWKGEMFDRYFIEENQYEKVHSDRINNIYTIADL